MKINYLKELNGCVWKEKPCKFLLGNLEKLPTNVVCSMGQQCCAGYCCYYLEDEKESK